MLYFFHSAWGLGCRTACDVSWPYFCGIGGLRKKCQSPAGGGEALPNIFLWWDLEIVQGVGGGCCGAAESSYFLDRHWLHVWIQ